MKEKEEELGKEWEVEPKWKGRVRKGQSRCSVEL